MRVKNNNCVTPARLGSLSEGIFLDAARIDGVRPHSFLFQDARHYITAFRLQDVARALDEIQEWSQRYWVAGYLRYEAAFAFLPVRAAKELKKNQAEPLVWFGVYERPTVVRSVDPSGVYTPLIRTTPQVSYVEYCQAIADIKAQIKEGNTYQVNYTFDVLVRAGCSPEVLYFYLRQFQQTPYCAFVKNIYGHVLSFSPELFFERQGQKILAMPMKGTAARGGTQEEDTRSREGLKTDTKNRAENLMIVDLLRNDLGRIAVAGSVAAPSLFDVETHPTLHQMTSLVQADLLAGITYPEMFRALFPCGSVTGAPKIRTMEIIQQVEKGGRGVYCGALGYISPEKRAVFSVPIRILQQSRGQRHWQYRVGSGIVWDSSTRGEWEEARVKMAFFATQSLPDFDLLETMLWDGRKIAFEKKHIARLLCSAKALKFCATRGGVNKFFIQMKSQLPAGQRVMLRLLLSKKGKLRVEKFSLTPSSGDPVAAISDTVLDSENALLQYKTTYRPWYDAAMARIKRGEIWDDIFLNQRGEVCEGARSNIFIEKGGKLYTPPAASGLLPGILRADLLENGKCAEKILMLSDLKSADAVYCGNSVRGLTRVRVL